MAPDPLDNNRNWVRAAMGLKHLKEGLDSFVEDEIVKLQSSFLHDIRSSHGLPPSTTCSLCKLENVLPCPTKGFCNRNRGGCNFHKIRVNCANDLCDKIAGKIMNEHRFDAPCWKNTDVTKWCSSPWEIAKCFMANGYSEKMSAKDTDCKGILSVIINCLSLQRSISTYIDPPNDIFSKMSDTRNKIIHSATLEVTEAELQQYIDDMIAILNDSKTIQPHPDARTARTKLKKIKNNTFVISSRDELELRKKAVEAIEQKQKELLEQCKQQQADLQLKLDQTLTSLTQAESTSQQKQADLQSKVNQTLTSLTQAESASQQKQSDLESKLDQTLTSLAQAQSATKQQQTDLQSKVDQTVTSLTQAMSASQQQQTHLQSKVDQTTNLISHNQAICLQNQKDLQSKCDQTMTSLTQAERQCQQKQDDIQSSQGQLYIQINSLQTQMTQVLEVLNKCQLDIEYVRSDLQKGTDKHDEHVKILEHRLRNRQLLQSRLRQKYTYQSTIPLSPIMKNMKVDINKVYQKLVIRPDLIHDPNVNTQDTHRLDSIKVNKAVNSYRDIFFRTETKKGANGYRKNDKYIALEDDYTNSEDEHTFLEDKHIYSEDGHIYLEDEYLDILPKFGTEHTINDYRDNFYKKSVPCKNIFVVGNGGVGKTTWCLKLLNTWLNCETNDEDNDNNVLQIFEYIFYVQLRHTKQASQINDMIKTYLFSDEHDLMNTVNDVLLNEPEQCLVLLDGLDEWKLPSEHRINDMGLPHDPIHSKYTTLITSRPWKLEILRLEPPAIDKAVEIKGLDNDGILKLAGHIIDKINFIRNSYKDLNVFINCIQKRKMPMIEVPLMLSIFVYLWYDNEFIGETFAELYGKLTVNLFKHAEGDKRQIKQNREISKLADIKDIEMRKTKWSNISISLPKCLSKGWCKSYSPLLYSLGKLAFYGILSINIESFLVFTQESIEEYMSEEELEVALYIGILSQLQSIGDSTGERFSISFVHKTIQEFLAAVYMVSVTVHDETVNIKSKFISYCKIIQSVLEIENILKFVCGMDPKLAGELTRHISNMHKKIIRDRNDRYKCGISDEERLHQTLLRCVEEEHIYFNESNHVYIVNHFIKVDTAIRENQNQVNTETFSYIHTNQNCIPTCLYIELCKYTRDPEEIKKAKYDICRGLSGVHTLTKLVIYGGIVSLCTDKGSLKISEWIYHLKCQTLKLEDIIGNLGNIDLSNNTELTDLSLTCIQLEELSLPQNGCLETVELKSIKHPHGDQGRLLLNMNNQPCVKHLTLEDIIGNVGHINLYNNSKLTYLTMTSLQIEELSLPHDGCLETLELNSLKHPQGDQGSLILNMNNQPCVKHLTLEEITGNVGHFNLSNNAKLTHLYVTSIQIEELSLPQDRCLETIKLKSIKHPQGDQGSIILNLNKPCLKYLTLEDISGNIGHFNLSNNSKLTDLIMASLQIEEITLPRAGRLQKVKLKYIKHPQGHQGKLTLNMDKTLYLNYLELEYITGNVGHINLSNNLELTYLYMASIQLGELSLPQDGRLHSIELKSIKKTRGDEGSLKININNQRDLFHFTLEDILCNIGHIDLSKSTNLTDVSVIVVPLVSIAVPPGVLIKS